MRDGFKLYHIVEPVMQWWIEHTPDWMQPKWVWNIYFWWIDKVDV